LKLQSYSTIKPDSKFNGISISKLDYPIQQLYKMMSVAEKIKALIDELKPTWIVIEEIAGSSSRMGQKTLDGLHWIVAYYIQEYLPIVNYYDVGGSEGWRTDLKLKLSDADKLANKEAKKLNPALKKSKQPLLPIFDWKDLSCRYVNSIHGLELNPQIETSHADIGDSIAMGLAWAKFKFPSKK
jgi:hypothetical protein